MRRKSTGPSVSFFAFQDIITAVVGIFILITVILILELTERVDAAASSAATDASGALEALDGLQELVEEKKNIYQSRIESAAETVDLNEFNLATKERNIQAEIATTAERNKTMNAQVERLRMETDRARKNEAMLLAELSTLRDEQERLEEARVEIQKIERVTHEIETSEMQVFRSQLADNKTLCLIQLRQHSVVVHDAASESVKIFSESQAFINWKKSVGNSRRHYVLYVEPEGVERFAVIRNHMDTDNESYGFDLVKTGFEAKLGFELESIE